MAEQNYEQQAAARDLLARVPKAVHDAMLAQGVSAYGEGVMWTPRRVSLTLRDARTGDEIAGLDVVHGDDKVTVWQRGRGAPVAAFKFEDAIEGVVKLLAG